MKISITKNNATTIVKTFYVDRNDNEIPNKSTYQFINTGLNYYIKHTTLVLSGPALLSDIYITFENIDTNNLFGATNILEYAQELAANGMFNLISNP